jgi:hypothetical protein
MRALVDVERLRTFMERFGREMRSAARVYLVGGASAVLIGWRTSTIDVDLKVVPDDQAFAVIAHLKEALKVSIELESPDHFIPVVPGWEDRCELIERIGKVTFMHFDFYSQALAKIERAHDRDRRDVREMIARGLIEVSKLRALFQAIEPELLRFPAIDPPTFRFNLESMCGS